MDGISPIGGNASLASLAQLLGPSLGPAATGAGGAADTVADFSQEAAALANMDIAFAQQAVTYRAFEAGAQQVLQLISSGLQVGQHVDARV